MKLLSIFFIVLSSLNIPEPVKNLVGTWKVEGKKSYETWEWQDSELKGHAYKIQADKKVIVETLRIFSDKGHTIFEATVPDQNEGNSIPFILHQPEANLLSFENSSHDFPKKIQYHFITKDEIQVSVLGDDGKGFGYTMKRVE